MQWISKPQEVGYPIFWRCGKNLVQAHLLEKYPCRQINHTDIYHHS